MGGLIRETEIGVGFIYTPCRVKGALASAWCRSGGLGQLFPGRGFRQIHLFIYTALDFVQPFVHEALEFCRLHEFKPPPAFGLVRQPVGMILGDGRKVGLTNAERNSGHSCILTHRVISRIVLALNS